MEAGTGIGKSERHSVRTGLAFCTEDAGEMVR